jgi:hypothetical protein
LLAHGRLAQRSGQPQRARELLACAANEARELGMKALQREADAALLSIS